MYWLIDTRLQRTVMTNCFCITTVPIIHIDTEGAVLAYGTSGSQFDGFTSAQNFYPNLWNGATLSFDAGVYGDTGFINQRVRLISRNGTALIGQE
ncbi:MAG: hypothetical protein LKM36_06585 [Flavobacteriales bacterium]|jgi:hypothetical protein|nr:hypothetical protein [Flavobacteriales bacterium]